MENSFAKKILLYAGSLFLVAASACIVYTLTQPRWSQNIKAEITNQPYARTITVSADGKVTSKPDIALIDLSVVSQGKTVKAVTQDGNVKMGHVIDAVKKLGIESKDITSTQYSLYPNYTYLQNSSPRIDGYNLTQNIQVKVRKLDQVDDVLDTGITAGANQVGQLTFDIDDPSALKTQAREKAFVIAKEKALEMTKAAGVGLGRVVTFSENEGYQPPMYANFAMEAKSMDGAVPAPSIEPGSKEMSLSISVTYEIQ